MGNKPTLPSFKLPSLKSTPQAPPSCPPGCATQTPVDLAKAQKLVERATVAKGPSACQVNDNRLNNAQKDVRDSQQEWDKCYPDLALQRKLRAAKTEAETYKFERERKVAEIVENLKIKYNSAEKLAQSAKEFYKTLYEKEKELASLTGKRENLEQLERRERRAFLDNDPQGGTGGAPGVRTTDDRVLLAFWITYGSALLSATIFVLQTYGTQMGVTSPKAQAVAVILVGIIGYSIPYYFINVFG